jgi:hypothetical protein
MDLFSFGRGINADSKLLPGLIDIDPIFHQLQTSGMEISPGNASCATSDSRE